MSHTHMTYTIDKIFEYSLSLNLISDVSYMAVEILDIYGKSHDVSMDKLKIIGIASLYISNKYYNNDVLKLEDMITTIDENYTKRDILNAEKELLLDVLCQNKLSSHINYFRQYKDIMYVTYILGRYLLDLSILYGLIHTYTDDILIPSILILSVKTTKDTYMTPEDIYNTTNHTREQITVCVNKVYDVWKRSKNSDLFTVRKYKHKKFSSVGYLNLSLDKSE